MVIISDQSPDKNKNSNNNDTEGDDLPRLTGSFPEQIIKIALANICSNIGWHSIGSISLDILTQVTEHWISAAGRYSVQYTNQAGRSEVTLPDLLRTLEDRMKFSITDLQDYVQNVAPHPISIKVPRFPANIRPSNRLVFALNHECPFGEDVIIGYAQNEDEGDASESNESVEPENKIAIRRSEYYDHWLPPFPSDSTASTEKIQTNGTGENTTGPNTGSDLKVSEIEPAPPLSAVYLNKDGQIISLTGKDGKGPDPTFPQIDSEPESASDSDSSILNLSKEEQIEPKVEKFSIKTSRLPKINKKITSSPSEKAANRRTLKSKKSAGPLLSIKVSGLHSGTPTASPKLSLSETATTLTPAMEERVDSVIDSVIKAIAGRSPTPSPPPVNASTTTASTTTTTTGNVSSGGNSSSKSSAKAGTSSKKPKYSSKEFVDTESEDSDEDDHKQTTVDPLMEPVPPPPPPPSLPPVVSSIPSSLVTSNSPKSPVTKSENATNIVISSPSKGSRKMYPEDIKAAEILLDISETPVVSEMSPFNLANSIASLSQPGRVVAAAASQPSPPAQKALQTLAARKVYAEPDPVRVPSPKQDETKVAPIDESRKRKKDKKNKKDKKKKRDEKDKDRKKDKKKPSSPDPSLKVNIKLKLKDKADKKQVDSEPMALTQSTSSKKESAKESSKTSCLLFSETIATISSDGKKGASQYSPGAKNSTSKSSSNKSNTAPAKKAVITETVTQADEEEKIWICPTCNKPDDGSPMICCDKCEQWFHWSCVGVKKDPGNDPWFCTSCKDKQKKDEKQFESVKKKRTNEPPEVEDESERKKRRKKKPG